MGWEEAAAGVVGGLMGMQGQQGANSTNERMQRDANQMNMNIAEKNNAASQANAREQMAFQEKMSSTAYQRSTKDMKAAGINPMVAYQQGGASSPGGAAGTVQGAKMEAAHMENAVGKGVSTAIEAATLAKEIKAASINNKLGEASTEAKTTEAQLNVNSAKTQKATAERINAEIPAIEAEAKARKAKAGYDEQAAPYDAFMSRISREAQTGANGVRIFKPAKGPSIDLKRQFDPSKEFKGSKRTGEITHP